MCVCVCVCVYVCMRACVIIIIIIMEISTAPYLLKILQPKAVCVCAQASVCNTSSDPLNLYTFDFVHHRL